MCYNDCEKWNGEICRLGLNEVCPEWAGDDENKLNSGGNTVENSLVTKDHFTDLRSQISKIKEDNKNVVFDYEADEKAARSHVATLRKSKTAINNLHKEKKKFFLEEGRKIDAGKNELIADVDEMIAVHAEPLQAIKERKEAEVELERKKVEMELDWDTALAEDNLFNREREMKRKEQEQAEVELGRLAKEKAEQDERDRIKYEAKVKADAEIKAKRDAEESLLKEKQEKSRLINEAAQREKQLKIDAENAEKKRIAYIESEKLRIEREKKEASEKAEREKNEAIAKIKREQEEKEKAEKKRIVDEKIIAARKAANMNHRKAVNNRVLEKLTDAGMSIEHAKEVMEDIIKNPISEITINY